MSQAAFVDTPPVSRLRTCAQLVRLPNVFTALADIALGTLAVHALGGAAAPWYSYFLLFLASACLYSGGMALNDVWDVEQDRKERPFRPIPSGRISWQAARGIGVGLGLAGVVLAALAGPQRSAGLALLLMLAIVLYDRWLKRFWAGPLGMGTCRFLNVLLGFSLGGPTTAAVGFYAACVVGLYIVGVTWFARTEARQSSRAALSGAVVVMVAAWLLALPAGVAAPEDAIGTSLYLYLLVGLAFWVGIPAWQALSQPLPQRVQATVKRAIFGLVLLDATLAVAFAGVWGLGLLLLLVPGLYLGRWIYST